MQHAHAYRTNVCYYQFTYYMFNNAVARIQYNTYTGPAITNNPYVSFSIPREWFFVHRCTALPFSGFAFVGMGIPENRNIIIISWSFVFKTLRRTYGRHTRQRIAICRKPGPVLWNSIVAFQGLRRNSMNSSSQLGGYSAFRNSEPHEIN